MVSLSTISPVALSFQMFHSLASAQGRQSARRKRHQIFWPVSQFGSSKDMAGMMQRLPYCRECLYEAFVLSSSLRALLVE